MHPLRRGEPRLTPSRCATPSRTTSRALADETDRIPAYYGGRKGGSWVVERWAALVGTFGLERAGADAVELRRRYVAPAAQRQGVARAMLAYAEAEARRRGAARMVLSTSMLQRGTLALYLDADHRFVRNAVAEAASHKTVGTGIRRFHFAKVLGPRTPHRDAAFETRTQT